MNYKFIIVLFFISLISCKDNCELNTIFKNAKTVKCNQLDLDELLGSPDQLDIIDNYLIFTDIIEDEVLTFYDITKDKITQRLFKEGQGPNDLLMPIRIEINTQDRVLSLFQRRNGIYKEYKLNDLINRKIDPIYEFVFPNAEYIKKNNDNYIAEGLYENGSIAIHDQSGNIQKSINVYPDYLNSITDISNKYRIGQGMIGSLNDSIFIFASYFTGDIQFYHYNNFSSPIKSYHIKTSSSNFKNRVEKSPQNTPILDSDIEHFTDIHTTDKYIYILYSGENIANKNNVKYSYVLKFDKMGMPIECYKTDHKLLDICVDNDNNILYAIAISDELDYILVRTALNTIGTDF